MAEILPGNGLRSHVAVDLTAVSTTLQIDTGDASKWPVGGEYRAVICQDPQNGPWEIVKVTGGQGTDTLTVVRAAESYNGDQTARFWVSGCTVSAVLTHDNLLYGAGMQQSDADARYLKLTGGTVTGDLAVQGTTQFSKHVAVGATPASNFGILAQMSLSSSGGYQYGIASVLTYTSNATSSTYGVFSRITTQAATFSVANSYTIIADSPSLGAGSSIANQYGVVASNQGASGVTNAYGVYINAQTGASSKNVGLHNDGTSELVGPVASPIYVGNTSQVIRNPVSSAQNLSLESFNGYAFMCAALNSHVASNLYWNGANWVYYTYNQAGMYLGVQSAGVSIVLAGAVASGNAAFTNMMTFDSSGGISMQGPNSCIYKGGSPPATPDLGLYCTTNANYMRYVNSNNMPHMFYNDGAAANSWVGATTSVEIRSGGIQAVAFATKDRALPAANQMSCAQLNTGYCVTEGGDWGGVMYWNHNGSYYMQLNSNYMQFVNMNVLSWGWVGFSGNPGIYMSWNGGQIATTHDFMVGGGTIYLAGNGGIYWQWTGNMYCPNSVEAGGYLRANNGNVYFRNDNAIAWYWDGSWMRHTGGSGIGTSGSYVWMANNAGVGMYWTGASVKIQPQCQSPYYFCESGGYYAMLDTNVRVARPAGTNIMYIYAYDAQWAFIRTYDGFNCGYVDGGGFHNTSKKSSKLNIRPITDGLSLVLDQRVTPIRYEVDGGGTNPDLPSMGFTAEDMDLVVPDVVGHDDEGPSSINYTALVAVLWDAVRTLNSRVEALEKAA